MADTIDENQMPKSLETRHFLLAQKVEAIVKANERREREDEKRDERIDDLENAVAQISPLTKDDVKSAVKEVFVNPGNDKRKWFAINLKTILTFLGGAGGLFLLNKLSEVLKGSGIQ